MSHESSGERFTIGIMHVGDLGAALARLMLTAGFRVVTTCRDRSPATRERARSAGVEQLDSLDSLVREADLVVSLVIPSAALEMAREYAALSHVRSRPSIYLDANSIDLDTLDQISALLAEHGVDFVDASIHGGAAKLSQLGVLYLSGPRAAEAGQRLQSIMTTKVLGERCGQASAMKLLLAGMSKSLNALFLEMAVLAERADMTEPFLEGMHHFYPGIMTAIERMLPTYPRHAARRVGELQSIGELADRYESPRDMVTAAAKLMQRVAAVSWDAALPSGTPHDLAEIVRQAAAGFAHHDYLPLNDTLNRSTR